MFYCFINVLSNLFYLKHKCLKCFDLSEVKMIIKQNKYQKILILCFNLREQRQITTIFSSTAYDVRKILERYQEKL